MKLSLVLLLAATVKESTRAFVVSPSSSSSLSTKLAFSPRRVAKTTCVWVSTSSDESMAAAEAAAAASSSISSDFGSAMPSQPSIYEQIGFAEDKVALGINPEEVLQWLGNRDDIVAKFQKDNPRWDEARAQNEVDRFMMDAEMVNAFIAYEKRRSDPKFLRQEAEANLSDPSTWATYAAWLAGGTGFAYVKNVFIEPKFASGEWQEIHINLGDLFHHASSMDIAADSVTHAVQSAGAAAEVAASSLPMDAMQSTVEAVAGAAHDAVTCAGGSCL